MEAHVLRLVHICIILAVGLPCIMAQTDHSLSMVIGTAIEYPCFADFVQKNEQEAYKLFGISTNNQMPQKEAILALGMNLPAVSTYSRKKEPPSWIRLEKVRLKSQSAKVFFVYNYDVKARIWLELKDGIWKVSRSFVRQKVKSKTGKKGSRFCMSF